jgi:pimeloyl-ACP methyl ester carboxylesterase
MSDQAAQIVLLPGFDGTGELFDDFVANLPDDFEPCIARYPADENHSYGDLAHYVEKFVPASGPFVIAAESFSVPIAIQYAANNPPNLRGLVLCAGFASSPVRGLMRVLLRWASPMLFRVPFSRSMIRALLVGCGAPHSLVARVQSAVLSVQRNVLTNRLESVLNCDVRDEVAKIRVPMLYLRARHDRIVPASCGHEIANLNSLCTIAEINGPHLLLQRNPVESANAIVLFVKAQSNNGSR